jgi:quercetin dioxygenase-like cupin family protein
VANVIVPRYTLTVRDFMSSIDRPLAGRALHFRLGSGSGELIDEQLVTKSGRSARTLVKEGPLRATLVALGPGGTLAPHRADGPITVHVLAGEVAFRTADEAWTLEPGDLLSLPAGVEHSVESAAGATFLLTVAALAAG